MQPVMVEESRWGVGMANKPFPALQGKNIGVWCQNHTRSSRVRRS
ncbi:hypothetical protein LOK49_LG07G01306 [Camellia lanceoleosa]|uniref:Uncharacterized protein n=1 Tax=Camellia lanceoleosa TaxID=1840588 RepID=A0ACC0GYI1_9ERIC|nr:hypothetical protein LOK49_LG07G01306 [Camellia lanceoleosa]